MGDDFRILKSKIRAFVEGLTVLEGGALELWMVNGELTLTEAEETLEMTGVTDRNDRSNQEKVGRFVKYVGSFPDFTGLVTAKHICDEQGRIGMAIINSKWTFSNPEAWDFLIYNRSGSGPLTTGASVKIFAEHYGVWVT